MKIQVARIAIQLLQQRGVAFLHDLSIPLTVRGMINVHMETPWIPNFWTVAICATKPGCESYSDFPIGLAEDGTSWFFPSRKWWMGHAHASHPPDGSGCDVDAHTKLLSREGDGQEFDYAAVQRDGTLVVLGRSDFVQECAWWTRAFGAPQEEQQP